MSPEAVMTELRLALEVVLMLAGPLLLSVLVVGVVVGVVQAATQVNEATIAFVAKAMTLAVVFGFGGAWFLTKIVDYTTQLILRIPNLVMG
ncbi:MAG TPA: flagellar biosynthetic protein FliQ [Arenimonas sp.]|nr:flagellar biosynthetic protein FliQ [Arenimonas sp.]